MPGFELDVTAPVGDISITTPDGKIAYDLMAITKEPMILFEQMDKMKGEGSLEMANSIMETLGSVMKPQNGGPPAEDLMRRLWDEGFLGINHLRQISQYVMDTAVGVPPA